MKQFSFSSPAGRRQWVPDAFGFGSEDARWRIAVLVAVLLASAVFGTATVAVGHVFPTRPIFYLAAPVMVVLVDPLRCFIGLIILRAILDPICVRAQFGGFGGLGGLFNLAIIVLAALLVATRGRELLTKDVKLVWVPFLVLMALDVVRSPDFVPAFRVWLSLLTYASIFFGAQVCVKNGADLDRMFRWILLTSVPVFIYAIVSFAIAGPEFVVEAGEGMSGRLSSPLTHPNILAFYTDVMLAVWLAKTRAAPLDPSITWRNVGWSALLLMLLVMLAGTQTRSAWVGAFCSSPTVSSSSGPISS